MKEKKDKRGAKALLKDLIELFFTFFKIGALCFGGGYAMISIIEHDVVEKKKWLTESEMMDILAVAESTPGPISVNTSTYVGTKRAGILGALAATLGTILPSFIIIFVISFFLEQFKSLTIVSYAFKGIRVAVLVLILNAVFKMFKAVEKCVFSFLVIAFVLAVSILTDFGAIYTLLICAGVGIVYCFTVRIVKYTKGANKVVTEQKQPTEEDIDL